jgi:hypothetical protein
LGYRSNYDGNEGDKFLYIEVGGASTQIVFQSSLILDNLFSFKKGPLKVTDKEGKTMRLYSKSFLGNANDRGGSVIAISIATNHAADSDNADK